MSGSEGTWVDKQKATDLAGLIGSHTAEYYAEAENVALEVMLAIAPHTKSGELEGSVYVKESTYLPKDIRDLFILTDSVSYNSFVEFGHKTVDAVGNVNGWVEGLFLFTKVIDSHGGSYII